MKLAKTLSIIIVVAIMVLATSCDSSIKTPDEDVFNSGVKYETKSISVSVETTNTSVSYYRYRLTPQWEDNDKQIVGATDGWVKTTQFPTEWNIWMSQGYWKVEIEMYDSSDNKIGDSFEEYRYINYNDHNLCEGFSKWLLEDGTGSLYFKDMTIPRLYDILSRYEMTADGSSKEVKNYYVHWILYQDNTEKYSGDLSVTKQEDAYTTFGDYELTNIPVGYYSLSLLIYEGIDSSTYVTSGGDMTSLSILRGCRTTVNATLRTSEFVYSSFRAYQSETGYTGKIKATYTHGSETATLELVAENATDIKWYQNGSYVSSYGNGTTANVKNISSGGYGLRIYGSCSNYFDCVFTNSETGKISSCSYVLVASGYFGGSSDDSSVLSLETGNEISYWKYTATPLSGIGETVYGAGSGQTEKSLYLDEGKWNIYASAYNNSNYELSNGTFVGYINKNNSTIDVNLESATGTGWLNISSIKSSRTYSGTYTNRSLSWTVTDMSTNTVVSSCSGSSSLSGNSSSTSWTFEPNKTYELPNGTYRIDLKTSCSSTGWSTTKYTGNCSLIVNIHSGVTTIVQGTLTTNYIN